MILNDIKSCLEYEFNLPSYYGIANHDLNDDWNYFVFRRKSISKAGTSRHDFREGYYIHLVMEDYIEQETILKIIKCIERDTKLKLADTEHLIDYIKKNNTDQVVEVLTLEFSVFKKGCFVDE